MPLRQAFHENGSVVDRLFMDANILFSAAYGTTSSLLRFWRLRGTQLLTSAYASQEAERNLTSADQRQRLQRLLAKIEIVPESPSRKLPGKLALASKDLPILKAAVSARASHLITGDKKHFGRYFGKFVFGMRILTPSQYFDEHPVD